MLNNNNVYYLFIYVCMYLFIYVSTNDQLPWGTRSNNLNVGNVYRLECYVMNCVNDVLQSRSFVYQVIYIAVADLRGGQEPPPP